MALLVLVITCYYDNLIAELDARTEQIIYDVLQQPPRKRQKTDNESTESDMVAKANRTRQLMIDEINKIREANITLFHQIKSSLDLTLDQDRLAPFVFKPFCFWYYNRLIIIPEYLTPNQIDVYNKFNNPYTDWAPYINFPEVIIINLYNYYGHLIFFMFRHYYVPGFINWSKKMIRILCIIKQWPNLDALIFLSTIHWIAISINYMIMIYHYSMSIM
jgi:hypothetical protein